MLGTTNPQHSLWEALLPEGCLGCPPSWPGSTPARQPGVPGPLASHFDPRIGRPSVPLDTYLRMLFLKFRYRLGDELLCREVADSISWQRFCRIPLGGQVPHHPGQAHPPPGRADRRGLECGAAGYRGRAQGVLRTHRVRADTTVVAATVCYPTDAGLLGRAIGKLAATIGRIQATRTRSGTGAAQPAAALTSSPRPYGVAASRPTRRCSPPPASWPPSPPRRSATPPGWPATPAAP